MVQVQVMPKVGLNMMHSSTAAVISYIGKQMDHKCKGLQLFTLVSAFAIGNYYKIRNICTCLMINKLLYRVFYSYV